MASDLQSLVPPGSLNKALKLTGPDLGIWNASYHEEFDSLHNNYCFEIISEEEYQQLYHSTGLLFLLCYNKKDSLGCPHCAKSQTVVLGNKDPTDWTKGECFTPVVFLPVFFFFVCLLLLQLNINIV